MRASGSFATGQIPFAHAGHWLVDLLFLVPVVVLAGWFLVVAIRDRRRDER